MRSPLVASVDTQDVCKVRTMRTRQAKRILFVSNASSKLIGVSTYRGYLMGASEQETRGSFQSPDNAHFL